MRQATQQDFVIPEFRGKDPADYEVRNDGVCIRKDRWEMGMQRVRELVGIKSNADWEIKDIIDAVENIARKET
ncbi:MAG: hypothetical protein JKY34_12540 [Kordiimonadaceae bacterium]|nr:hypothetical protein [Kordiimonadaceae bacterium]PCJ37773.1 MAG: hypothetical protein COA75_03360 [Cellvibrionales bacterium]